MPVLFSVYKGAFKKKGSTVNTTGTVEEIIFIKSPMRLQWSLLYYRVPLLILPAQLSLVCDGLCCECCEDRTEMQVEKLMQKTVGRSKGTN